eukprot:3584063-Prymnesium_polylepis.2
MAAHPRRQRRLLDFALFEQRRGYPAAASAAATATAAVIATCALVPPLELVQLSAQRRERRRRFRAVQQGSLLGGERQAHLSFARLPGEVPCIMAERQLILCWLAPTAAVPVVASVERSMVEAPASSDGVVFTPVVAFTLESEEHPTVRIQERWPAVDVARESAVWAVETLLGVPRDADMRRSRCRRAGRRHSLAWGQPHVETVANTRFSIQ